MGTFPEKYKDSYLNNKEQLMKSILKSEHIKVNFWKF